MSVRWSIHDKLRKRSILRLKGNPVRIQDTDTLYWKCPFSRYTLHVVSFDENTKCFRWHARLDIDDTLYVTLSVHPTTPVRGLISHVSLRLREVAFLLREEKGDIISSHILKAFGDLGANHVKAV